MNGGNVVAAINERAVSPLTYSAGIMEWKKAGVEAIDRKERKMFTIYGVLNPRTNTSRIYLPRKEGRRELISAADCVTMEQLSLNQYVQQSQEMLLKSACHCDPLQSREE